MKKSTMIKQIAEKTGLSPKTVEKVIDAAYIKGMQPPFSWQSDLGCECGCKGTCPKGHAWDYEHAADNAYQTHRKF